MDAMKAKPKDEVTLLVPPCGMSFEDCLEFRLYYCPAKWKHRKAKYLGIYSGKSVRAIGRIAKVVPCTVNLSAGTVTVVDGQHILTPDERERIIGATKAAQNPIGRNKPGWDLKEESQVLPLRSAGRNRFPQDITGRHLGTPLP
jgi:hypothetical protein